MNFHFVRLCYRYLTLSKISLFSVFIVLGGVTLLVIALCAPLLFWAESQSPNANIQSLNDAVWLSFMIVTTIGFGDFFPVTLAGRMVAVPLAATGIGVFGTLAGYFGSLLLDRIVRQATTDMLHDQNARIEALAKQNHDLNETIRFIASENKKLNKSIVELSQKNEELNLQIKSDTQAIIKMLQEQK